MRICVPESQVDESIHLVISGPYDSQGQCEGGCGDGNPGTPEMCPGEKDVLEVGANSLSLSRDAQSVAVGEWSGAGDLRGVAKVFNWLGSSWSLEHSVQGSEDSMFGYSVSMNQSGSAFAAGARGKWWVDPLNPPPPGYGRGYVEVYEKVAGVWTKKGQSVPGAEDQDHFGNDVKLSADGSVFVSMALPKPWNVLHPEPGNVRAFQYSGGSWIQKGQDLGPGRSLAANLDCGLVAFSVGDKVKVYEWGGSSWIQKGSDIVGPPASGPSPRTDFGLSLSMSDDGLTLATGSHLISDPEPESGIVRVYRWSPSSSEWEMKGDTIFSDANPDQYQDYNGWAVSLNGDGDVLAIGAPWDSPGDILSHNYGQTRIFRWVDNSWSEVCTATGLSFTSQFGGGVCLDGTGNFLVASEADKVRTFIFQDA